MKIPFLNNVRRGLATNSSSSHSLVYMHGTPGGPTEQPLEKTILEASGADTEYGWTGEAVETLGEKLMYALTDRIGETWSARWSEGTLEKKLEEAIAKYGHLFPEFEGQVPLWVRAMEGYVDHQSRGTSEDLEMIRDRNSFIVIDHDNH